MRIRELRVEYRVREDPAISEFRTLGTPREVAAFVIPLLEREASEVFGIVCLSTKHDFLAWHEVARGSLNSCIVHPREVFKAALLANAACIVGAHNHPSGDPTPSTDDVELTRKLAAAGVIVSVEFVDNIIVGQGGRYYSFKEGGHL